MISLLFSISRQVRIVLSILYLAIIVILSLLPPNDLPTIPSFVFADKLVHICMYLGLSWLLCWLIIMESRFWLYLWITFLSIGWGVLMEVFQLIMKLGRSFDYFDILANAVGTFCGILIYFSMMLLKKRLDLHKSLK